MRYVTAEEMRNIDRAAIEKCGIPASRLMENAGRAVAVEASKLIKTGGAIVFSGYGNNGGDGFVAARHLVKKGYEVKVFLVGKPRALSPETNANLEKLFSVLSKIEMINSMERIESSAGSLKKPDVIIDAIFGTGMRGELDDFHQGLIDKINSFGAPIISVDIPSGLNADTGKPMPTAIKAVKTVTLGFPKVGFKNAAAAAYVGELIVADIGFPKTEAKTAAPEQKGKDKTVRLRAGKHGTIRLGHPWIYGRQLLKTDPAVKPGDMVTILDSKGKFLGRGYYNPRSGISARILTFSDEPIDKKFFEEKIRAALRKRDALAAITNAYRIVFSEADGLSGLIVDRYADTAVFQILTLGMESFRAVIVESIRRTMSPKYIYEKSLSPFRKIEGLKDAAAWHGEKGRGEVEIFEGSAKFLVDIEGGHKTGFYLDQRRSRLALRPFVKDRKVLDLFCYTGAFSVTAALGGAGLVKGVDIKEEWLGLARRNAALNGVSANTVFIKEDGFKFLKDACEKGERFDVIILDPPSFLKTRESLASASKGYEELNFTAMKLLTGGGVLATFSCSHNMPNELFSSIIKEAAKEAGKKFTILKRCHQAEDHPIVRQIPETEYLKGYFLKIG